MGKKQHQKDKMYLTSTEWSTLYGGKKNVAPTGDKAGFRRLPFDHCALSLQPFENPLCTPEGVVYELMSIVPFLKKHGTDPATGKQIDAKSLVKLNFTKNSDNKYHCPVLFKVFNENSHIVAVKNTGNVFSFDAVEQLNLKAKNFKDLLDDTPFTRADIITIQDPNNLQKFNLANFHHIRNNIKLVDPEEEVAKKDSRYTLKHVNNETRDILNTLDKEYKAAEKKTDDAGPVKDKFNAAHYSTGTASASFTSTAVEPSTRVEAAVLADDVVRYSMLKKKGYVQLQTSHGNLNLELFCEVVPKTCENFVGLALKGYYNGTVFHRSIRNFILQGGDPEGTGRGGDSLWGGPFEDECKVHLVHQGRGVLSMANSGPNTNKSQFFISYRSCRHLDTKHTVFGKVVGGLPTLQSIEDIETDNKDRPIEEVKLIKATVFVNPFQEADDELAAKREEELAKEKAVEKAEKKKIQPKLKAFTSGVGKYIDPNLKKKISASATPRTSEEPPSKKKAQAMIFGGFSGW